jgi:RNA polymerase sigma factor (sigma-70 family)
VDERAWLAEKFEDHRTHLRAVAWRMLGSSSEADDAVQEAWLRLSRSDVTAVQDLGRWLTTVVARVCLDALRSRGARREEPLADSALEDLASTATGQDPAQETLLTESVGQALLVVLDTLAPAERLAFVLHDIFAVPYAEIAPLVDRTTAATKMLASRARRRVQRGDLATGGDTPSQRVLVQAFLAASRDGDFEALLALLDPDAVFRADSKARRAGAPADLDGGATIARQFSGRARGARLGLIDGAVGLVWVLRGNLAGAFDFTVLNGRIIAIEMIGDAERLAQLGVTVLAESRTVDDLGRT